MFSEATNYRSKILGGEEHSLRVCLVNVSYQGPSFKLIAVSVNKNGFEFHEFLFTFYPPPSSKHHGLRLISWGEGLDNGEVSKGTVTDALGNAHTCLCVCHRCTHCCVQISVFGYNTHSMDV